MLVVAASVIAASVTAAVAAVAAAATAVIVADSSVVGAIANDGCALPLVDWCRAQPRKHE